MIYKLEQSDFDMIDEYIRVQDSSPCRKCPTAYCCTTGCYPYTMYGETNTKFFQKVRKLIGTSSLFEEYLSQRTEYLHCKAKADEYTERMRETEPKMNELQAEIRKEFE